MPNLFTRLKQREIINIYKKELEEFFMLRHNMFGEDLFDTLFDMPMEHELLSRRNPLYGKNEKNLMKTDIKETESGYELDIDLPGFKKEDISVELENGYLTISASKDIDKEENKESGGYIRKERWFGSCSRSFYIGDGVRSEDIKAKMENGILHMTVPKATQQLPKKNTILIEG